MKSLKLSNNEHGYCVHDHLYSVAAITNLSGDVQERIEYDAYGIPTFYDDDFSTSYSESQLLVENPYLFTGRRVDILVSGSLKLQYNRNRYYSYTLGRWLTQDPLGITPNPQSPNYFKPMGQYTDGLNVYEYVKSRPAGNVDVYGLKDCSSKDSGVWVYCATMLEESWWERGLNDLGFKHCDVTTNKHGDVGRSDNIFYDTWIDRSKDRKMLGGKSCECATPDDVQKCVLEADHEWSKTENYCPLGSNCHTQTAVTLSKCCLKTSWKIPFTGGSKDALCKKYKYVNIPGYMSSPKRVCVEWWPDIN